MCRFQRSPALSRHHLHPSYALDTICIRCLRTCQAWTPSTTPCSLCVLAHSRLPLHRPLHPKDPFSKWLPLTPVPHHPWFGLCAHLLCPDCRHCQTAHPRCQLRCGAEDSLSQNLANAADNSGPHTLSVVHVHILCVFVFAARMAWRSATCEGEKAVARPAHPSSSALLPDPFFRSEVPARPIVQIPERIPACALCLLAPGLMCCSVSPQQHATPASDADAFPGLRYLGGSVGCSAYIVCLGPDWLCSLQRILNLGI